MWNACIGCYEPCGKFARKILRLLMREAEGSVSYGELKTRATAVAAGISEKDIKGVPVALTCARDRTDRAALGILLSGNSYLPVSLSQPKDRRALIHEKTGVRYVVTNRELSENWTGRKVRKSL